MMLNIKTLPLSICDLASNPISHPIELDRNLPPKSKFEVILYQLEVERVQIVFIFLTLLRIFGCVLINLLNLQELPARFKMNLRVLNPLIILESVPDMRVFGVKSVSDLVKLSFITF